ncbi:Peptidoglycan-associated outer membrane protein [Ignavibacterium album JCM 16511]|uniref:Peptidoglycan-associated outer membrane protein n=1 Tax=Ignavibacterium album (strain DSM 19864 / JCM 16511 / NBRC 101810 / Mat9-16) TaxID=945713 RepID=I0AJZ9_IGNAJ|nr:OmpA family protein [Ignavibacterium album]AFH49306.1 Peptidoglycan-associated outer membrane protein [Ignavibacterium album JCM 16511]
MKKYTIIFFLSLFLFNNLFAQFKEWGTKLGLRYNQILPINEFNPINNLKLSNYQFSWLAQGFLAFELTKATELQITAGYGFYRGADFTNRIYRTDIIPIDLRLRISPFDMKGWNPYFYFGGGGMNFTVKDFPRSISPKSINESGWTGYFPAGIGSEFAISDYVLLDFSFGGAYTLSDDLNYFKEDEIHDFMLSASFGITFTGESGSSDRDKDGLTKNQEETLGTNPKNPDSDADGLKDGEEVNKSQTNPLQPDTDLDGLSDYDEIIKTHTNPILADTDGDGLTDFEELNKYKTDPLILDTDNDGLTDGEEIIKYYTDPLKADMDMDGLTDKEELLIYLTEPKKADSDSDQLNDAEEVIKYTTNPLKADTDDDGINDYDEIFKYKTNPLDADTDAGTVDDKTEVERGTDPLNAEDDVVKVGVPIVLEGIYFETGKADITAESEFTLRKALLTLQSYPEIVVEISGHTDITGMYKKNLELSQKRADAVRDWLIRNGIDPLRIIAKGYGPDRPIASNDTPEGRQKNRRIEFTRIK